MRDDAQTTNQCHIGFAELTKLVPTTSFALGGLVRKAIAEDGLPTISSRF